MGVWRDRGRHRAVGGRQGTVGAAVSDLTEAQLAFARGREVESCRIRDALGRPIEGDPWVLVSAPQWDTQNRRYRVKRGVWGVKPR